MSYLDAILDPCDNQYLNTLKIQQLENNINVNKNLLGQLLLTVQTLLIIIMVIMFIILVLSLYEIFRLKQIKIYIPQNEKLKISKNKDIKLKYEKEKEELKKRIDFLEHDC